ncbi:MAG: class I SAM-dependent rRNA methyltransferase [Terriglobales bacterium]
MHTAIVRDRAAARLAAGHGWVYRDDLLGFAPSSRHPPEAPVAVATRRGGALGWADYSPNSQIALRLLTRDEAALEPGWLDERLRVALAYRQRFVAHSEAYRLVAGEADGLPGLIVDRYGAALAVQSLTAAMEARQGAVVAWLRDWLHPQAIIERNDTRLRRLERLEARAGLLYGESAQATAEINGLRFGFDLLAGQKTGGFLDQRENWAAAARYTRPGAEALDAFTYQGGFAVHLARAGAQVAAADLSRPALEAAERNAQANSLDTVEWIEANAFDLLRHYDESRRKFDMVVLDPPGFARNRAALAAALRGYKEINLRALRILHASGILVTCSCSHNLEEAAFFDVVLAAAVDAGRSLVLLERRTQSLDHPVLAGFPETQYLKCLILLVR